MAVNNPVPFTMHSFSKSTYRIYKDILVMIYISDHWDRIQLGPRIASH